MNNLKGLTFESNFFNYCWDIAKSSSDLVKCDFSTIFEIVGYQIKNYGQPNKKKMLWSCYTGKSVKIGLGDFIIMLTNIYVTNAIIRSKCETTNNYTE